MLLVIVSFFLVVWWLVGRWKRRRLVRLAGAMKSRIKCPPLIGEMTYALHGDREAIMKGCHLMGRDAIDAGGAVGHWFINKLYISVADPEIADVILKKCLGKDELMNVFHEVIGNGSIFAPVELWRPRRKLLAPMFSMKNLNLFTRVFSAQSAVLVQKLNEVVGQGPVSTWRYVSSYAMDAVCETTLGVKARAQDKDHPTLKALEGLLNTSAMRICSPLLRVSCFYKCTSLSKTCTKNKGIVQDFINNIITETRRKMQIYPNTKSELQAKTEKMKSFVEIALELDMNENDEIIRDECIVLFAAGSDTSAVALGFIFLMLSEHPDVQDKLYREFKETFGDDSRPVTVEDLHHLKYTDAVVKETLRLYPPVPVIVREIDKDVTLPSGLVIPAGCGSMINIWAVQRNPAHWGADAEEYRPERFFDAMPEHPAAFMPFSAGPRNCLGYQYAMMSIKTVVATVLRRYRVAPAAQTPSPPRLGFEVMMRDLDGYCVSIEKRQ